MVAVLFCMLLVSQSLSASIFNKKKYKQVFSSEPTMSSKEQARSQLKNNEHLIEEHMKTKKILLTDFNTAIMETQDAINQLPIKSQEAQRLNNQMVALTGIHRKAFARSLENLHEATKQTDNN